MATSNLTVTIGGVQATKETEKGLLVEFGGQSHWLAKSQIDSASAVKRPGDKGNLVIAEWFAKKAGLVVEGDASSGNNARR